MATGPFQQQIQTQLNITSATVIKAAPGCLVCFAVTVAGSGAGTINDCATTGAAAASNAICATPAAVGVYQMYATAYTGLTVIPGSGQTITVTWQ